MRKDGNDKTTMTTREVAVLIEEFRSQFRAFGDELKTIVRRLDSVESTVARIWEKITEMDLRLIRVESRLVKVEADVGEIKIAVKDHSQRISHLEAIK